MSPSNVSDVTDMTGLGSKARSVRTSSSSNDKPKQEDAPKHEDLLNNVLELVNECLFALLVVEIVVHSVLFYFC